MDSPRDHCCLSLEQALPAMAGAASVGQLVPLIGAGTSRPLCRGWEDFLKKLSEQLKLELGDGNRKNDGLYRFADRAAFALRLQPKEERRKLIAWALRDEAEVAKPADECIPPQARALAAWYWPLVITTNYDDVFIAALGADPSLGQPGREKLTLLGRGPQDCEAVLRSLDVNTPRILWCIQGYVGGILPKQSEPCLNPFEGKALLEQIVIGHQQYQQAAYQSPSFRRAFAEVYRRRSLAFIGSGLTESYFVNLLSEIVLNFGPGSHSHFALFSQDEYERHQVDGEFLRIRLGVTPVIYGDTHKELPKALQCLLPLGTGDGPDRHAVRVSRPLAVSFSVPRGPKADDTPTEVSLRFKSLPQPGPEECVVVSVGLDQAKGDYVPRLAQQAKSFLCERYNLELPPGVPGAPGAWRWIPKADPLWFLFRLEVEGERQPVFALAARDQPTLQRNLHAITDTTQEALAQIEKTAEFRRVLMGVLAAGHKQFAHPTFCFIAQLVGVRRFTQDPPRSERRLEFVEIRIVDPCISAPVIEGRIPVRELLSSNLVRVFVRVADTTARHEGYMLDVPDNSNVSKALEMLQSYNVYNKGAVGGQPRVKASPLPYPGFEQEEYAPIFPMMTIEVEPPNDLESDRGQ